jgi:hypothetical protein
MTNLQEEQEEEEEDHKDLVSSQQLVRVSSFTLQTGKNLSVELDDRHEYTRCRFIPQA